MHCLHDVRHCRYRYVEKQSNRYTFHMDQTRETNRLRSIGEEYYNTCFEYDLTVCSGRTKEGKPVPIDDGERIRVKDHAYRIFQKLCAKHQLMMKALRYARRDENGF